MSFLVLAEDGKRKSIISSFSFMPPTYIGAAKRPIGKTKENKKTKENIFTFQWKVEQKKTFIQRKNLFYLFLFVFVCFFFVRSFGAKKNLKTQKYGLLSHSYPIFVHPPCPGYTFVSRGRVLSLRRLVIIS